MDRVDTERLIERKYREVFAANIRPCFEQFLDNGAAASRQAVVGYQRAGAEPLFLEAYLDEPVEAAIARTFGVACERSQVVEIGNFAADDALAMLELWGSAANDLGNGSEYAVATLTAPLRRIFARIGIPITIIAQADADRIGATRADWGAYYDLDPQVCVGRIIDGQKAIAAWLARRGHWRHAA